MDGFGGLSSGDKEVDAMSEHVWRRAVYNKLATIEEQVKCTNGRVTSLEQWKWAMGGGLIVVSLVLVPMFITLMER